MAIQTSGKRWSILILLLLTLFVCSGSSLLVANASRQSLQYPGSQPLSEHHIRRFFPNPTFKSSQSYLADDKFPDVLNWYSHRFRLGVEKQAQSKCSHHYATHPIFLLSQTTTLTLCDTSQGRMIFVQQTTALRWSAFIK